MLSNHKKLSYLSGTYANMAILSWLSINVKLPVSHLAQAPGLKSCIACGSGGQEHELWSQTLDALK